MSIRAELFIDKWIAANIQAGQGDPHLLAAKCRSDAGVEGIPIDELLDALVQRREKLSAMDQQLSQTRLSKLVGSLWRR